MENHFVFFFWRCQRALQFVWKHGDNDSISVSPCGSLNFFVCNNVVWEWPPQNFLGLEKKYSRMQIADWWTYKSISFNTIIDIGLIKKKKEKKALEIMSTFSIITRTKKFRFFFLLLFPNYSLVFWSHFLFGVHTPLWHCHSMAEKVCLQLTFDLTTLISCV